MTKTLTRADLSEAVYQKVGLSRSESAISLRSVIEEICKAASWRDDQTVFFRYFFDSVEERAYRAQSENWEEVPITPRGHGVQTFQHHERQVLTVAIKRVLLMTICGVFRSQVNGSLLIG